MPTSSHPPKAKITVTLSPDVVRQLDALLETLSARSRSQLVGEVLRRWLEERVRSDLEAQTEAYYRSPGPLPSPRPGRPWLSLWMFATALRTM
jgi:hypothetical protein